MAIQNQVAVEVVLQLQRLRSDLRRLQSSFDSSFKQVQSKADGLRRALRNAIVGAFAGLSAKSIIEIGVEMDSLRRRLKVVSKDAEDFNRSMRYLQQEADRLGRSFSALVDSYTNFRAATDAAGLSVDEANRIFTAFNEAITALGLSTEESGRIFLALRQMVSGGVLQLQELNQIAESLPGAFNIFAQAVGTNVQGLRELTSEARINAAPALLRVAEILERRFGQSVVESSNSARAAFNRLQTAWQRLADTIARSGVLDIVTDAVNRLTKAINDPKLIAAIKNFTTGFIEGLKKAAAHIEEVIKLLAVLKTIAATSRLGSAIGGGVGGLVGGIIGSGIAVAAIQEVETLLKSVRGGYKHAADAAEVYANQVAALRREIEIANSAVKEYSRALAEAMKAGDTKQIEMLRGELNRWAYKLAETRKALELLAKSQRKTGFAKPGAEQAETPVTSNVLAPPKPKKTKTIDVKRELAQIEIELLRLQGRTVEATRRSLQLSFAELRKELKRLGDVEGLKKLDKLINLSVAKKRLAQLRESYSSLVTEIGSAVDTVNQKVQLGIVSQQEGQRQLRRIYQDALRRLEEFRNAAAQIPGSEEFIAELNRAVQDVGFRLAELQNRFSEFFTSIRDSVQSALSDLFYSISSGTKSLKDVLLNFVQSIVSSMQRKLADQLAETITDAIFGQKTKSALDAFTNEAINVFSKMGSSLSNTLGKALSSVGSMLSSIFSSFSAALFHDGRGLTQRRISGPVIAPKLHDGLMPDEFLAVLQKGEAVLPKNIVRQIQKNENTGGRNVVVNNTFVIDSPTDRTSQEQIAAKAGLAISRAIRRIS